MDINEVILTKQVVKSLKIVPQHVVTKFHAWIDAIEHEGWLSVRKIPGYHDEPLKGDRKTQRSIRLSKAYRAIYHILESGEVEIIEVLEINKHRY